MKLFKRKRKKTPIERHKETKPRHKSCIQLNTNDLLADNRRKRDEHLKSLRDIRTLDKDSHKFTHSGATRSERDMHLKLLRDCHTLAEVGYPEVGYPELEYPTLSKCGTETSSTSDYSDMSSVGSSLDRDVYLRSRDSTAEKRIPRSLTESSCSRDSKRIDRYSSVHDPPTPSPVTEQSLTCLADQISFQSNDYWYDSKTKNW